MNLKLSIVFAVIASSFLACRSQKPFNLQEIETQGALETEVKMPKNIILMIGDGMGVSQIYGGMIANHNQLALERFKHLGFIKTYSSDNIITDSGAGATAFSIGKKTFNGAIGVCPDSLAHETILQSAALAGKSTGMVVTCAITHATPASFATHVPDRNMYEEIAWQLVHSPVDVMIGGGRKYFDARTDGRGLIAEFQQKGIFVVDNEKAMQELPSGVRFAALLWEDAASKKTEGRDDILPRATAQAIAHLNAQNKGFFLMVEGAQIDWGGHANETDYIVQEMIDFDQAIALALDFAEEDGETLVIVTADHETGGFALVGGNFDSGTVKGAFTSTKHTAVMVPVFAFGPGAALFTGIQENTAIYNHMMHLWGLEVHRNPKHWKAIRPNDK
ncbi:MAG: alkaline phosphatase [Bacteroidia bacterium]